MKNNRNHKKMNEKKRIALQYIIMTFVLSVIFIVCAFGIMSLLKGTQVKAIEKEDNIQVNNFEHIEPTVEPATKTIDAQPVFMSMPIENEEPEYINLGEYRLTAYCSCEQCCGEYGQNRPKDKNGNDIVYTASGKVAQAGYTVAADPSVLPYGTIIYINGQKFEVQDCGGAIKGNRIDIYFDNHEDAREFGVQYADVFVENY